jgi:hypothetical protein
MTPKQVHNELELMRGVRSEAITICGVDATLLPKETLILALQVQEDSHRQRLDMMKKSAGVGGMLHAAAQFAKDGRLLDARELQADLP